MDLLTILLPVVGAALGYAYKAYVAKTGTDPLANRPILQLLFQLLTQGQSPAQQLAIAQQLGIHNDPATLQAILAGISNQPSAPKAGPSQQNFLDNLTHLPIKISLTPQFQHPDDVGAPTPQPPHLAMPGINIASA